MSKTERLKQRLQAIAEQLDGHPGGLGLLGLGSAGKEMDRMDEYSDLDFFAIVSEGHKQGFIDNLSWLSNIHPVTWAFRNTADGYKLLFEDGVFCEFAVFEPWELNDIPYSEGKFVYKEGALPEHLATPKRDLPQQSVDVDYLLGELLTNLYVGLCRYRRGEKVSAMRFIQVYAMDRLINLLDLGKTDGQEAAQDPFCPDRRVEARHPEYQALLLNCSQGAQRCPQSAAVMLAFVKQRWPVHPAVEREINALL